jgi:hypothetical protein
MMELDFDDDIDIVVSKTHLSCNRSDIVSVQGLGTGSHSQVLAGSPARQDAGTANPVGY